MTRQPHHIRAQLKAKQGQGNASHGTVHFDTVQYNQRLPSQLDAKAPQSLSRFFVPLCVVSPSVVTFILTGGYVLTCIAKLVFWPILLANYPMFAFLKYIGH